MTDDDRDWRQLAYEIEHDDIGRHNFLPSPAQVDAGAAAIRDGWSRGERMRRGAWMLKGEQVEFPCVDGESLGLQPDLEI